MEIIFATTNQNKLREAEEILGIEIKSVKLNIDEIQTLNPEESIRKKASSAYHILGKPVLVEDTSLFFDAWNGLPGVFIDYFLKTVGIKGLLKMMKKEKNRKAEAVTFLGIFDGKDYKVFKGRIKGRIPLEPKGKRGFGWDPIFIPEGFSKTFAQLDANEKNRISMRRRALTKLKVRIEEA